MTNRISELPECIADCLCETNLSGSVASVRRHNQDIAPKFLARRLQSRGIRACDRYPGAFAEKLTGCFQSDASGSACHQSPFVLPVYPW